MSKGKIAIIALAIILVLGYFFIPDEQKSIETTTTEIVSVMRSTESEETETTITTAKATTNKTTKSKAVSSGNDAELTITMLDVGQGLSVLIECDDEYMLYDGGGRSRSSYVVSYLKSHNVSELEYMVASHYDEDHIAGLVGVLNTTTVNTVIDPDYTTDSKIYNSFCTKLDTNGSEEIHPSVGDKYKLGDATFTVLSPARYSYESENSYSVAIRLTYGNFSCIITGDAETDAESDMLSSGQTLSSDLYIVGHHGSSSSSNSSFVKRISPSYAFISVGSGNSYGHPTSKTMNTLKNNNIQVFRSDKQGEVTCYSNGTKYWFSEDPCNDYSSGNSSSGETTKKSTTAAITQSAGSSSEQDYVLNTSTKKFHYPSCSSVDDMAEHNKQCVHMTRDEIISNGYSPCGRCKP